MSFYGSLSSSVSTIAAMSAAFETISENIINSRTIGYKTRETRFYSEINQQPYITGHDIGSGSSSDSYYNNHQPNPVSATKSETDFAINGQGYFITREKLDGGRYLMTNNGAFERYSINKNEKIGDYTDFDTYLVDKHGHYLLGWAYDPNNKNFGGGALTIDTLEPINIRRFVPIVQLPKATSNVGLDFNVPVTTVQQAGKEYNLIHRVYDGTGTKETDDSQVFLSMDFKKTANYNEYEVSLSHGGYSRRGEGFKPNPQDNIVVAFAADGTKIIRGYRKSTGQEIDINNVPFVVNGIGGASNNVINYDFSKITNYNAVKSLFSEGAGNQLVQRNVENDGNPYRIIHYQGTEVGEDGTITILYTHGIKSIVAKLPYGKVFNPRALITQTGPTFEATENSGDIQVLEFSKSTDDNDNKVSSSQLIQYAVNESNTNITKEMSNMIVAQRAYNTAATALRTIDEMIKTAADIKG